MEFLEKQEADTIDKELKTLSKIIPKINSRFIPPHQKEKLSQVISDGILNKLPQKVQVFELIPYKIYSKRVNNVGFEFWSKKELNNHFKETFNNKNFFINFDNYNDSEKCRELDAYLKIFKYCQKSYLEKDVKENMYKTISDIFLENTPEEVKSFNLVNGIISERDSLQGETWNLSDMKEYINELDK